MHTYAQIDLIGDEKIFNIKQPDNRESDDDENTLLKINAVRVYISVAMEDRRNSLGERWMLKSFLMAGICVAGLSVFMSVAEAETIRIAEHRQARIDALKVVVPDIEKKLGVTIEVIEYPAPEKD